jgi:hypothetical protein
LLADISDTADTASLEEFGYSVSVPKLKDGMGNDDCFSLVEIGTYGAKGLFHLIVLTYQFLLFVFTLKQLTYTLFVLIPQEYAPTQPTVIN